MKILGISGSLRARSYNTALLRAAAKLLPEGTEFEIAAIGDLPLYDDDLRAAGYPAPVARFRAQLRAAEAVWIATPEYNYSIPGVLKNAIDWASRPPEPPFQDKPVAIMGAATGVLGTARAQYHLRQVCVFLEAHVLGRPEVFVGGAAARFDDRLELADEATRKALAEHTRAFLAWIERLRR